MEVIPQAYYLLGQLEYENGAYDEAIQFLDVGLKLENNHPKLYCEKAFILLKQGKHQESLELN